MGNDRTLQLPETSWDLIMLFYNSCKTNIEFTYSIQNLKMYLRL